MRIPMNKSAAQSRIDKLEERLDVIEHGLLFEIEGVDEATAREAFRLAGAKLSVATMFVKRQVR